MVIFLVMQTVDNAMKMKWKKTLFGGKMKIDNSGQKKVPAYIPVGQEIMQRYAKKVDGVAQNILLEVLFNRPTTAHILGGCPMSETAESGVVDKNLKVHGYPNMFITDGSVIQGNIGVNPSLTITAVAEYAMNLIPKKEGASEQVLSTQLKQLENEWIKKKSD
jgi:cholesterol oxidase